MKILKKAYIYFFLFFVVYYCFACRYTNNIERILCLVTMLIPVPFFRVHKIWNSVTAYILTIFYYVIGVYQFLDTKIHTKLYTNTIRISDYILLNESYRLKFSVYWILSYIIMLFAIILVTDRKRTINVKIGTTKRYLIRINPFAVAIFKRYLIRINPFAVAILWNTFRFIFQRIFYILVPGQSARISHVALYIYMIRIITLALWAQCIKNVINDMGQEWKFTIKALMMILIFSLPQALLGSRSEVLLYLIQYVLILIWGSSNSNQTIKGLFRFAPLALGIVVVGILISNYIRTGTIVEWAQFIRDRITGIVDGVVVIKYLDDGGQGLTFINFLLSIIGADSAVRMTSFYTHVICGYPTNLVHSWSIPSFASGLIYGGVPGMLFFSALQAGILGYCEDKCRKISNIGNNIEYIAIFVYLYVNTVFSALLEGNVDLVFGFVWITLATGLLFKLFNVQIGNSKNEFAY